MSTIYRLNDAFLESFRMFDGQQLFFYYSCSFFHSISVKRIEKDGTGGQTGTQDRLKRVGEDRLKDRTLQTAFTKIGEEKTA